MSKPHRRCRRTRLALTLVAAGATVLSLGAAPATAAPDTSPSATTNPSVDEPIVAVLQPSITGEPFVGKTLTANDGTWSIPGVSTTRRWLRNGVPIPGATGTTYTLTYADQDTWVGLEVVARRAGFQAGIAYAGGTWVNPRVTVANIEAPAVTGTVAVGRTVTADGGWWTPWDVELSYQWLRGGVAIAGATAGTYTVQAADYDKPLAVRVTATHPTSADVVTRTSTARVVGRGDAPLVTTAPSLSGTPRVGATLTVNRGSWVPANTVTELQWFRGSEEIGGATGPTYVPTVDDLGRDLTVRVKASSPSETGWTVVHTEPVRVQAGFAPVATVAPAVSGAAHVGSTLTAFDGTWSPAPDRLTRQWLRDGQRIDGATGPTYLLTTADLGRRISLQVTAERQGYAEKVETTAAVTVVARPELTTTSLPTISGAARWGEVLSATAGTWTPAPEATAFQWLRDGAPIPGATRSTYRLRDADMGSRISVRVRASHPAYVATSATSASVLAQPAPTKMVVKAPKEVVDGSRARVTVDLTLSAPTGANGRVRIFDGGRRVANVAVPRGEGRQRLVVDTARLAGRGWHTLRVAYTGTRRLAPTTVWVQVKLVKR